MAIAEPKPLSSPKLAYVGFSSILGALVSKFDTYEL
jgi:hypothetical protein